MSSPTVSRECSATTCARRRSPRSIFRAMWRANMRFASPGNMPPPSSSVTCTPTMRVPDSLESPHKGQRGIRRLINALFYSISGLMLAVDAVERVLLIASVLLVLVVELLNSSVEAAIDRIGFDAHRLSKRAKDLGSAAVLVALAGLLLTWLLLAGPAVLRLAGAA